MRKRKKSIPPPIKLKAGDVLRGYSANLPGIHTIIVLNNEEEGDHLPCVPMCNFTGTEVPPGEYAINVSHYRLPDDWFGDEKAKTWLRCNFLDCVNATDPNRRAVMGNILELFPKLWEEVCEAVKNCPIAPRLSESCDCNYDNVVQQIAEGISSQSDCGCAT